MASQLLSCRLRLTFYTERYKEKKKFFTERLILKNNPTLTQKTCVKNELGMHARPASQIAQIAETASSDVWLYMDSQKVDASSIIDILALCAVKGSQIRVEVEDEKDVGILNQIVAFFESGFGE